MNKTELVAAVATKAGITQAIAKAAIDGTIESITSALAADDRVAIAGFGIFVSKNNKARVGRNPSSGASIDIPASRGVSFKPAKEMKEKL